MVNKCGSCQVCCELLQIEEINKPDFKICPNQFYGGCKIYEERPASCRVYECSWLRNGESEKNRPDRVGVLFSDQYSPLYGEWTTIHVIKPEARSLDRIKKKILEIIKRTVLIEMTKEGMVLLGGPENRVHEMISRIEKQGGKLTADGLVVQADSLSFQKSNQLIPKSRLIRA